MAMPTLGMFKGGKMVDRMVGYPGNANPIREWIAKHVPAAARLAAVHATKSESTNQNLADNKLVPPANGLIKVACGLSANVTPIDWVGPQAVFGAYVYDESLKKDRPLFEVFTVGASREPIDEWLIPD